MDFPPGYEPIACSHCAKKEDIQFNLDNPENITICCTTCIEIDTDSKFSNAHCNRCDSTDQPLVKKCKRENEPKYIICVPCVLKKKKKIIKVKKTKTAQSHEVPSDDITKTDSKDTNITTKVKVKTRTKSKSVNTNEVDADGLENREILVVKEPVPSKRTSLQNPPTHKRKSVSTNTPSSDVTVIEEEYVEIMKQMYEMTKMMNNISVQFGNLYKKTLTSLGNVEQMKKPVENEPDPNIVLEQSCNVSPVFAEFCGTKTISKSNAMSFVNAYILKNKLQHEDNTRTIDCDEVLNKLFGTKSTTYFELSELVGKHLLT